MELHKRKVFDLRVPRLSQVGASALGDLVMRKKIDMSPGKMMCEEVHEVMRHCLYDPKEVMVANGLPKGAVIVDGLTRKYGLHPGRVTENKDKIARLLGQLPDEFMQSKGGGWSFLNMCTTRDGDLWGEHQVMQDLLVLGIAAGLAEYLLPRAFWYALPGGVPYFVIKDAAVNNSAMAATPSSDWSPVTETEPPVGESFNLYRVGDNDALVGWRCAKGGWWAAQPGTCAGVPINKPDVYAPIPKLPGVK